MDGLEVIRRLRDWTPVPIVVLSAHGSEKDKVAALDAGADDYLTKPFSVGELLARLRVALRHAATAAAGGAEGAVFLVGKLKVDLGARRVFLADAEVHLTPIEYRLLAALVGHAGRVLTHRMILAEVWGPTPSRRCTRCASSWPTCAASSSPTRAATVPPHRAGRRLSPGG